MGDTSFVVLVNIADREAAFESARQDAACEFGWREDNGTIATKEIIVVAALESMTYTDAKVRVEALLSDPMAPYCDHHGDIAGAIPIAPETGEPCTGWLFFGYACI